MTGHEIVFPLFERAELLPFETANSPLSDGEVAGRTLVSLISAGTELGYGFQGNSFPSRPGYAAVFRVEQIGANVENLQIGDLALCMGGHRSHQRQAACEVWRVPDGLDAGDATFARLMGVSMSTLTTTTARPPERVLITGLGPVGHLAAQIFHSCGYGVLACDPDATRREFAARAGIEVSERVASASEFALALECSGHEAAALDACRLVKKRGEVVLVGVPWRRRTEIYAHELLHAVFHRYVVLRSGWEWEVPRHDAEFRSGSIHQNIVAALHWLQAGRVSVTDLYATRSPREAQATYQALAAAQEKTLATVFDWTQISG